MEQHMLTNYQMLSKYVDQIDSLGGIGNVTTELLSEIIQFHAALNGHARLKYERYKSSFDGVPIHSRILPGDKSLNVIKVNNRLANDWVGEIVDTKVGYMFGQPCKYELDKAHQGYEKIVKMLSDFDVINNLDDKNAEVCKMSAAAGYDAILQYFDRDGKERIVRVDPWEVIILARDEITDPTYAIRHYELYDGNTRVMLYDDKKVRVFEGSSGGGLQFMKEISHMYNYCPLVGIPNNKELQGDADKVLSLIDGYDRSMSDLNSEIEQFRLAYMMFLGFNPKPEELALMIQTGALFIPDGSRGQDIKWLVKDLKAEAIEKHLDRIEKNITKFAKHVNFSEAAFSGDITGPAMRYKLFMLEAKAKYFERKHEAAMRHIFKNLAYSWGIKGTTFDYTALGIKYTRNIPVNLLDEAQTASALMSITSRLTALSTLSVVQDPEEELKRIEEERVMYGGPDLDEDTGEEDTELKSKGGEEDDKEMD